MGEAGNWNNSSLNGDLNGDDNLSNNGSRIDALEDLTYQRSCSHAESVVAKETKVKKYFVNNYDHLPTKGPLFVIKKVARKANKTEGVTTRKRTRQSEAAVLSQKSKEENSKKKSKNLTKNTKKSTETVSKESPECDTDCEKNTKETLSKLAKDSVAPPSPYIADQCLKIFQTHKHKSKEDKKSSDSKAVSLSKKAESPCDMEKSAKQNRDNEFNDFLFKDTERTRTIREPKKVTRNLKDDPITHFSLSSERI